MRFTSPASPGDERNPFDSDNEEVFVSLEDELFGTIEVRAVASRSRLKGCVEKYDILLFAGG